MIKLPKEVLSYYDRIGAEVSNFKKAYIKKNIGVYEEIVTTIHLAEDGTITCKDKEYLPKPEEAKAIEEAMSGFEWPTVVPVRSARGCPAKGETWEVWNLRRDEIIMVQEKVLIDGQKKYLPWVFHSDGEWRRMEPDVLPFWKPKNKRGPGSQVMIHEGAKAAKAVTEMLESDDYHPWRSELEKFEHWGMLGGALAGWLRSDYDELSNYHVTRTVYSVDNDIPGLKCLNNFSRFYGKSLQAVRYGRLFPESWDLADPFPEKLFTKSGRYNGPAMKDLISAATFATKQVPTGEKGGKPITVITDDFKEEWVCSTKPYVFINKKYPNSMWSADEFNRLIRPFSHVDDTARILHKELISQAVTLRYEPGREPGVYTGDDGCSYFNTFKKSTIEGEDGDVDPFLDFMEYMFPKEEERHEVLRWCATLIARPDVRMLYGLLLISETQGVGKGTLGEGILRPLVGVHNVSTATEQELVESDFNYWAPFKRLTIVHEIYQGNSMKAYNKLKSVITDGVLKINQKYVAPYEIDNWITVFACSNSMSALKIEDTDRRWLIPLVTEEKRDSKYFDDLYSWLKEEGGLRFIRRWAENFCKEHGCVQKGEAAPFTSTKMKVIEDTMSSGRSVVSRILCQFKDKIDNGELPRDSFLCISDLQKAIMDELHGGRHVPHLERPLTIKKIARNYGWYVGDQQIKINAWGSGAINSYIISLDPETAKKNPAELAGRDVTEKRNPLNINQHLGGPVL